MDKETLEKMDKDRFRQSLGGLIEAYEAVARRLGVQLDLIFLVACFFSRRDSGECL